MGVCVRTATLADQAAVKAIADASWRATYASLLRPETIEGFLAGPYDRVNLARRIEGHSFFVAEEDDSVVGFADAVVEADRVFLAAIYVAPTHLGRGVGSGLLHAVIAPRPELPIEAYVLVGNERAEAFYGRRGFKPIERIVDSLISEVVIERKWRRAPRSERTRWFDRVGPADC